MRVGFELIFLLIAAVLGWAAFNWSYNADQVGKKTGFDSFTTPSPRRAAQGWAEHPGHSHRMIDPLCGFLLHCYLTAIS
jgi:hypothetical protein